MPRAKTKPLPTKPPTEVVYIKNSLKSIGKVEDFEYDGKPYSKVNIKDEEWIVFNGSEYYYDTEYDIKKVTPQVVRRYNLTDYFVIGLHYDAS